MAGTPEEVPKVRRVGDIGPSRARNRPETREGLHRGMDVDVALVQWPSEDGKRQALASAWIPRLLLVAQEAEPPELLDHLEDWVRLPASSADTRARVEALAQRANALTPLTPVLEDDRLLRFRNAQLQVSELHGRLLATLVEHFGKVVDRPTLLRRGWPNETPTDNTLDVQIARLRRRLAPLGLQIRTVRSRGFLLAADGAPAGAAARSKDGRT